MVSQPYSGVTRSPYVRPCRLVVGGREVLEGFLCNISVLGAYVAVDPPLEVGERVSLRFSPGAVEPPMEVDADVAWCNQRRDGSGAAYGLPQGCGLRFTALTQQAEERIRAFVDPCARSKDRPC